MWYLQQTPELIKKQNHLTIICDRLHSFIVKNSDLLPKFYQKLEAM